MYFSARICGFIPPEYKSDGTYTEKTWPNDAVELSENEVSEFWKKQPPDGMQLGSKKNRPSWIPLPQIVMTRTEVEERRLLAYADPVNGSDRFFAEVVRMQAVGLDGWQLVRDAGVARYTEIQATYPWPEPN